MEDKKNQILSAVTCYNQVTEATPLIKTLANIDLVTDNEVLFHQISEQHLYFGKQLLEYIVADPPGRVITISSQHSTDTLQTMTHIDHLLKVEQDYFHIIIQCKKAYAEDYTVIHYCMRPVFYV